MCQHEFTKWVYVSYYNSHYDIEEFYQRTCIKCGLVEEKDVEEERKDK